MSIWSNTLHPNLCSSYEMWFESYKDITGQEPSSWMQGFAQGWYECREEVMETMTINEIYTERAIRMLNRRWGEKTK